MITKVCRENDKYKHEIFVLNRNITGYDEKQALFVKHLVKRMTDFKPVKNAGAKNSYWQHFPWLMMLLIRSVMLLKVDRSSVMNTYLSYINYLLHINNCFIGYIVWTGSRMTSGTLGLQFIVQGPKDPAHVLDRVEAFLDKTRPVLFICFKHYIYI
uniref:Peptidase_M16_C domain-containing protein n=1 Tax=Heterorhabditis bacteriophora TaxID=37862 RepID=A0A1I7WI34_HETBA